MTGIKIVINYEANFLVIPDEAPAEFRNLFVLCMVICVQPFVISWIPTARWSLFEVLICLKDQKYMVLY
jgi:hypothetical protein